MRNNIPDQLIVSVLDKVETGEINPNEKRYVFRMAGGRFVGIDAENESEAREAAEKNGDAVLELWDIEQQTFSGMTLQEIKILAKKRNLGELDNE